MGIEEERKTVEELAGSCLNLITSVGAPLGDCRGKRQTSQAERIHLIIKPDELCDRCI